MAAFDGHGHVLAILCSQQEVRCAAARNLLQICQSEINYFVVLFCK